MMRTRFACFFLCINSLASIANGQSTGEVLNAIAKSKPDTNRIHLLLKLGDYYKPNYDNNYNIINSKIAIGYYNNARQLSKTLNNVELLNQSLFSIGDCYIRTNDYRTGKAFYLEAIHNYHHNGALAREAAAWSSLADAIPYADSTMVKEKDELLKRAYLIYKEVKIEPAAIQQLQKIAEDHLFEGRLEIAERELLNVLACYKKIGYKKLYLINNDLSRLYKTKGNLSKQLFYLLEMIRNFEVYGSKEEKPYYYFLMGGFYKDWGSYDNALAWCLKSVDSAWRYDKSFYSEAVRQGINIMLLKKKHTDALAYLENAVKKYAPVNASDRLYFNECFGDCFSALGQFPKAGEYYIKALADYRALNVNKAAYSVYEDVWINQKLGDYYFNIRNYKNSAFYFDKLKSIPVSQVKPAVLNILYLSIFRTDSALNDFVPAIKNYQLYKKLSDSMFSIAKSGQIAEMQAKYESAQKERSIALLTSESKVERAKLKSLAREREIALAGITMLLISGVIAYRAYRNKQRSNQQLKEQQNEINMQNLSLRNLIDEKDSLLNEKDWLLKEIHHRVKNNLQVVMGLLNAQSAFLESREAITAIRESQNRVHSISLIHQKLYTTENAASVRMISYINDLLLYLSDCYGTKNRKIRFEQIVDDLIIDISQAVPLGLIMNEAITNAIKYAFGPSGGEVIIAFKRIGNDNLMLMVTDNGKGISEEELAKENKSLGMKMMQILSKQLGAAYKLDGTSGVTITLEFREEKLEHNIVNNNTYNKK